MNIKINWGYSTGRMVVNKNSYLSVRYSEPQPSTKYAFIRIVLSEKLMRDRRWFTGDRVKFGFSDDKKLLAIAPASSEKDGFALIGYTKGARGAKGQPVASYFKFRAEAETPKIKGRDYADEEIFWTDGMLLIPITAAPRLDDAASAPQQANLAGL